MSKSKTIDKTTVRNAVLATLQRELAVIRAAAEDAAEGATHEENRPEHDKDMRSTEASYLARGQAGRAQELSVAIATLEAMPIRAFGPDDKVSGSAVVNVEIDGDTPALFFVASAGGGVTVTVDGVTLQTITARSPVGAALLGKSVGDVAEVKTQQGMREYEIVSIA